MAFQIIPESRTDTQIGVVTETPVIELRETNPRITASARSWRENPKVPFPEPMNIPIKEFKQRRKIALAADYEEITSRLIGLLDWMESIRPIERIIEELEKETEGYWKKRTEHNYLYCPPQAKTVEEIAREGLEAVRTARKMDHHLYAVAEQIHVTGKGFGFNRPSRSDALVSRYVIPFLDVVERSFPHVEVKSPSARGITAPPAMVHDSLKRFHTAHRNASRTCFIMMRFGKTPVHAKIETAIKKALKEHGLTGLLARDREFHDDLYANIQTYMHGCEFGIAVFERLETNEFNPNVALEVGYMMGLRKQVLLLKDRTLTALHTDLVGKMYREFDPQEPGKTIPSQIDSWLSDKGLA